MSARSRRGTGNVFQKRSTWHGRFYVRGKRVKRSLGPVRQPGSRDGLTKVQAEARLRELMAKAASAPAPVVERLTVGEAGERLVKQLRLKGRKPSTIEGYESYLRVHLVPHFSDEALAAIDVEDVEDFLEAFARTWALGENRDEPDGVPARDLRVCGAQAVGALKPVQGGGGARAPRQGSGDSLPRTGRFGRDTARHRRAAVAAHAGDA